MQTNLPAGVYTLSWTYSKGPVNVPIGNSYVDAAWVDQVTLTSVAPIAPKLGIQSVGTNAVLLYWPSSVSVFRLQQTVALTPIEWTNSINPVNVVNGTNQVLVAPTARSQFYRLVYP